jgi:hypothetical protein
VVILLTQFNDIGGNASVMSNLMSKLVLFKESTRLLMSSNMILRV